LVKATTIKRSELAWILIREFQFKSPQLPLKIVVNDVRKHWARREIEQLVGLQIMSPAKENKFKPEKMVTRKELARIAQNLQIWRSKDQTLATTFSGMSSPYTDVSQTDKDFNAILMVTTLGIMEGYYDGSFKPENLPTGQELFHFIEKIKDILN